MWKNLFFDYIILRFKDSFILLDSISSEYSNFLVFFSPIICLFIFIVIYLFLLLFFKKFSRFFLFFRFSFFSLFFFFLLSTCYMFLYSIWDISFFIFSFEFKYTPYISLFLTVVLLYCTILLNLNFFGFYLIKYDLKFYLSIDFFFDLWLMILLGFLLCLTASTGDFYLFYFLLESSSFILLLFLLNRNTFGINPQALLQFYFQQLLISCLLFICVFFLYLKEVDFLNFFVDKDGFFFWNFLLLLLFVKLGFVPSHLVQFDLYENLLWYKFGFLTYIYKFGIWLILFKFLMLFSSLSFFFWFVFLSSFFFGTFGVLEALTLRRLFLYASLFSNSIVLFLFLNSEFFISFWFFVFYIFWSLLAVFCFISWELTFKVPLNKLHDLRISISAEYVLIFSILFLILSGLPPFVLFWIKLLVYEVFLIQNSVYFFLFVLGLFCINSYAYIKILKYLLYDLVRLSKRKDYSIHFHFYCFLGFILVLTGVFLYMFNSYIFF